MIKLAGRWAWPILVWTRWLALIEAAHPSHAGWRTDSSLLNAVARAGLDGCTCSRMDGAALSPAKFTRDFVRRRRPAVVGNLTAGWRHGSWASLDAFVAAHGQAWQWERWGAGHRQAGTLRRASTVQEFTARAHRMSGGARTTTPGGLLFGETELGLGTEWHVPELFAVRAHPGRLRALCIFLCE
jgi:hypothetical protein